MGLWTMPALVSTGTFQLVDSAGSRFRLVYCSRNAFIPALMICDACKCSAFPCSLYDVGL